MTAGSGVERRGLVDFRKAKLADLHDWARTKPKQQPPRRPRSLRIESDNQDELLLNPHNDDCPSAQVTQPQNAAMKRVRKRNHKLSWRSR